MVQMRVHKAVYRSWIVARSRVSSFSARCVWFSNGAGSNFCNNLPPLFTDMISLKPFVVPMAVFNPTHFSPSTEYKCLTSSASRLETIHLFSVDRYLSIYVNDAE